MGIIVPFGRLAEVELAGGTRLVKIEIGCATWKLHIIGIVQIRAKYVQNILMKHVLDFGVHFNRTQVNVFVIVEIFFFLDVQLSRRHSLP
jgi:hypothetical protein